MAFIWLMYVADVVGSISTVCTLSAIFLVLGYGLWFLVRFAADEDDPKSRPKPKMLLWALGFAAIASVLPSQRTVYAMAAVSAGRDAASTETGQKALKALNAWLDRQAAGEK